MRFSLSTAVAALPALAAAQDFQQYQAQFQDALGQMYAYIPNPGSHDHEAAQEAKASMKLDILSLENWKETLYEPVVEGATTPEEWWVLLTGGNKTCQGRCGNIENAFTETAKTFAALPEDTPHMGLINCDKQPILCNSWSAGPGSVWIIDLLPPPAEVNIYKKRLNLTTTTSEDLLKLKGDRSGIPLLESWFHPFNGQGTVNGLSIPFAYFTWVFSLVPNWLFMIVVSYFSRTMMSRRMQGYTNQ